METKWNKEKIRKIVYDNIKEIAGMRADLFVGSKYVGVCIFPDYSFDIYFGDTFNIDDYDNDNCFLIKLPMYGMVYDFLFDIDDGIPYDLRTNEEITFKYAFDKVFDCIVLDTHKILNDKLEYY